MKLWLSLKHYTWVSMHKGGNKSKVVMTLKNGKWFDKSQDTFKHPEFTKYTFQLESAMFSTWLTAGLDSATPFHVIGVACTYSIHTVKRHAPSLPSQGGSWGLLGCNNIILISRLNLCVCMLWNTFIMAIKWSIVFIFLLSYRLLFLESTLWSCNNNCQKSELIV